MFAKHLHNPHHIRQFIKDFSKQDRWHEQDEDNSILGYAGLHHQLITLTRPTRILCIGSRFGYIPAICALACRDINHGHVDFVDANLSPAQPNRFGLDWGGLGYWSTSQSKKTLHKWGLTPYLTLHLTTSQHFFKQFPRSKWSYIHLDGDHSYQGIKHDFLMAKKSLDSGGFIALHDIYTKGQHHHQAYGVHRLWQQLKHQYQCLEIPGRYGLGLVQIG